MTRFLAEEICKTIKPTNIETRANCKLSIRLSGIRVTNKARATLPMSQFRYAVRFSPSIQAKVRCPLSWACTEATPKVSSVNCAPRMKFLSIPICFNQGTRYADINKWRRLTKKIATKILTVAVWEETMPATMNWPDPAYRISDIRATSMALMPDTRASAPAEKPIARYPSTLGIQAIQPAMNCS